MRKVDNGEKMRKRKKNGEIISPLMWLAVYCLNAALATPTLVPNVCAGGGVWVVLAAGSDFCV